jgi:hypothetical protein
MIPSIFSGVLSSHLMARGIEEFGRYYLIAALAH